jgi:hypothetical protein
LITIDDVNVIHYPSLLESRKIKILVTLRYGFAKVVYFLRDGDWYGLKITTEAENGEFQANMSKVIGMREFRNKFIENANWFTNRKYALNYVNTLVWADSKIRNGVADGNSVEHFTKECERAV